jgi:hypothetical protein
VGSKNFFVFDDFALDRLPALSVYAGIYSSDRYGNYQYVLRNFCQILFKKKVLVLARVIGIAIGPCLI